VFRGGAQGSGRKSLEGEMVKTNHRQNSWEKAGGEKFEKVCPGTLSEEERILVCYAEERINEDSRKENYGREKRVREERRKRVHYRKSLHHGLRLSKKTQR